MRPAHDHSAHTFFILEQEGGIKLTAQPSTFELEVTSRFGLVPNFFASAPDAPEIIEKLWGFAKAGYLDNPIPSLFKERLFVYVSRFCQVRYCIVRHCAFLLGYGHSSGDPACPAQTIVEAIKLLKMPTPWQRDCTHLLDALETGPSNLDWPASGTAREEQIFSAAAVVFVEPGQSGRARRALRHALGGRRLEFLLGLLAYIRTAHYWTVIHPELRSEEDVVQLLEAQEELARLLLQDPEAGRCDLNARLFAELLDLRGLNERRELEKATKALEAQLQQKELMVMEANHRVKNSLQIVSGILHLQVPHAQSVGAGDELRAAAARVLAIATVHERLYNGEDVRVVGLKSFVGDLCADMERSLGCPGGLRVEVGAIDVPTDMAVPLALIVNELVTNAIKHAGPPCRIAMGMSADGMLNLRVSDPGQGPPETKPRVGLGTRLVAGLADQLRGHVETIRRPDSYSVEIRIPMM